MDGVAPIPVHAEYLVSAYASAPSHLENPSFSLDDPETYDLLTGGQETLSGINVSPDKAMSLAPVWQAVSIISGDFAAATAHVFRRDENGDRDHATDHPADYLIAVEPNPEMSAFELFRRMMLHALIWQEAFIYVDRVGRVGSPRGLYNLLPDRTCAKRDQGGALYYETEVDGTLMRLTSLEVIHIKGLSYESGEVLQLLKYARESWGLAMAAEGFGSKFFANGAQAGGIIEIPIGMSKEAADRVASGVQRKYTGKDNWFRTMVLRDGAKFHATTIDASKSQLTELREHQVRETARFFNLPPGKLGLEDSVSYNSAEQAQIQYITGCLTHWFAAVRGEMQLKLFTPAEKQSRLYFIDFNSSKLIERDLKTTVEILEIERRNEIINAAEWRRKRDLPPRTDPQALEYTNTNIQSTSETAEESTAVEEAATTDEEANARFREAARGVLADALTRMCRRVGAAVRKTAKNGQAFEKLVESNCGEHHATFRQVTAPAIAAVAAATDGLFPQLTAVATDLFFSQLTGYLSACMDKPAADLETNAEHAIECHESTVVETILNQLIPELEHKDA